MCDRVCACSVSLTWPLTWYDMWHLTLRLDTYLSVAVCRGGTRVCRGREGMVCSVVAVYRERHNQQSACCIKQSIFQ